MKLKRMNPRYWSNEELRKFASLFSGDIINISGWKDEDKNGFCYRDYFINAKNYYISNYPSDKERGVTDKVKTDYFLDLSKEIPDNLREKFDVIFNHTTLEHVENPNLVFKRMAEMTKDIFIIVVPFKQKLHFSSGNYGDYYRFSPMAMRSLFERNGFFILYESYTPPPAIDVYLFYIGTKQEEKWKGKIKQSLLNLEKLNGSMGMNNVKTLFFNILLNLKNKLLQVLKG